MPLYRPCLGHSHSCCSGLLDDGRTSPDWCVIGLPSNLTVTKLHDRLPWSCTRKLQDQQTAHFRHALAASPKRSAAGLDGRTIRNGGAERLELEHPKQLIKVNPAAAKLCQELARLNRACRCVLRPNMLVPVD